MANPKPEKKATATQIKVAEAKATIAANKTKKIRKPAAIIENPIPRLAKSIGKAQRKPGMKGVVANVAILTAGTIVTAGTVDAVANREPINEALTIAVNSNIPGARFIRAKAFALTRMGTVIKRAFRR
ncbi:hypothetical protein KAR91_09355 [Candidatus Pacearchaeota archaeon]|nr:hypothetical protein [Candidatus Pacearchaeota archaeon]